MEDDRLLRVDEVAERLRVSEETVRRMLRAGRLRGVRLGSTKLGWRIPASELARLLGQASRSTIDGSRRDRPGQLPRREPGTGPQNTSEAGFSKRTGPVSPA